MTPDSPQPVVGGPHDPRPKEEWRVEDGAVFYPAIGKPARPQCTSRAGRKKREAGFLRCEGSAMHGLKVCYTHGGAGVKKMEQRRMAAATSQPGAPFTRGGAYSGSMSEAARKLFHAHRESSTLLQTEDDVALIGMRAEQMLGRAKEGDSVEFRRDALKMFGEVESAVRANDTNAAAVALSKLKRHLGRGVESDRAYEHAVRLAERRAHRAERAREVAARERASFSIEEVRSTLAFIAETIIANAGDQGPVLVAAIVNGMKSKASLGAVSSVLNAGQRAES